jgi:hypothetical protein
MKRLENNDHNLPHMESREKREAKSRKSRGDQACMWGYSSHPENCNLEHDVAQMASDPLAAIIDAINGPDFEDTDEYKQKKLDEELGAHKKWEKEILERVDPTKPEFPESYWQAYSNTPPPPTTTFRPWNESSGENFKGYTQTKSLALVYYRNHLRE